MTMTSKPVTCGVKRPGSVIHHNKPGSFEEQGLEGSRRSRSAVGQMEPGFDLVDRAPHVPFQAFEAVTPFIAVATTVTGGRAQKRGKPQPTESDMPDGAGESKGATESEREARLDGKLLIRLAADIGKPHVAKAECIIPFKQHVNRMQGQGIDKQTEQSRYLLARLDPEGCGIRTTDDWGKRLDE